MIYEILRVYDSAVAEYVESKVKYSLKNTPDGADKIVPVHIATPDRPYGFDFPSDPKSGSIDTTRTENMLQTPQVSVTRLDMVYDMNRNQTNPVRKGPFWDDDKSFRIRSEYPRPWLLTYHIDVHARRRNDIQAAIQHWLYYINPTRVLTVDFKYPWGKVNLIMTFDRIIDNSDLETEEKLRYYRYTIPFTLEAYMFQVMDGPSDVPPFSTNPDAFTSRWRTVKEYRIQVTEESSGEIVDEIDLPGDGSGSLT